MEPDQRPDISPLLTRAGQGDPGAVEQLVAVVYDELRALASSILPRQQAGQTLRTTALVHEAYLKLVDQSQAQWADRAHFFAVAARAMRHILVDHARNRGRAKRGGDAQRIPLDDALDILGEQDVDVIQLDDALTELARHDERKSRVVELRFFGDLSIDETAAVLDLSTATVERDWRMARAWLHRALKS